MENSSVKSGNEIIAEFMGLELIQPKLYIKRNPEQWFNSDYDLKFDTSWDWLMPVVEKITPLARQMGQIAWFDTKYTLIEADISGVYTRVVAFITWYQNNKQPKQ